MSWQEIETAPKDRPILVRALRWKEWEHSIVYWNGECEYPWQTPFEAFRANAFDQWHEIPR